MISVRLHFTPLTSLLIEGDQSPNAGFFTLYYSGGRQTFSVSIEKLKQRKTLCLFWELLLTLLNNTPSEQFLVYILKQTNTEVWLLLFLK